MVSDENCADAHYALGVQCREIGDVDGAVTAFRRAVAMTPTNERFCFGLAAALQAQGLMAEAIAYYRKTLDLAPNCAPAHYNLGCLLLSLERFSEAAAALGQSLLLGAEFPHAHNNLGAALVALGRHEEAKSHFSAAVQLDSGCTEAHYNLGRLLSGQQHWAKAIPHFKNAITSNPDHTEAMFHLALCHHRNNEFDTAHALYARVIERVPTHAEAHLHQARLYLDRHEPERALMRCRQALAANSSAPDTFYRVGQIFEQLGCFSDALACLDATVQLQPANVDAHFNRALMLLRLGRLNDGWPDYEWRYRRANWPQAYPHRLKPPRWNGQAFRGQTLLVHCEQGYGDTLQFARYLPMVKSLGGRVLFEVPEPLIKLLRGLPGVDELIELSPTRITARPFDQHIPLLSLPGLFRTTLETIPAMDSFIAPDPSAVRRWKHRLGPQGFKIGIVWAGSAWHHNDRNRSCRLTHFLPIARIPGVRLIGIQKGAAADEIKDLPPETGISNIGSELRDFSDTAALLQALDLIVSVDTAVVHLAGIMRKPVWVLLPFIADWRWFCHREDSPWYPSLRLFRQSHQGDWESVFNGLLRQLQRMMPPQTGSIVPPSLSADRTGLRADAGQRSGVDSTRFCEVP